MRVLYLTMNPNRASTTVPTEGWLRLLPERGLAPVVCYRTRGPFIDWVERQGVPCYQNDLPFPAKASPFPFARAIWGIRRIVKRHRIELIHCNEQDVYPPGQYAGRLCGLPVVTSVHFTMNRGFCEWAFGGRRQPARIFFISRGNLEACRPAVEGIIDPSRWRLLYNGLDLERFAPDEHRRAAFRERLGLNDAAVVVGVACALRPRKQIEHLVDAVGRLNSPALRVVIAGGPVPGDEDYAARLLADARARLGDRLTLLGHLDDLRDFYNGLDVFVNTSREEACSISVMEALACGCPVLGYPSKSVDDQILPDGGEIVAQDDVAALSQRLGAWAASRQGLRARRPLARRRAEDTFDIRKLADQLWGEYLQVMGSSPPGA
jgi:glycosyltransferase involved in cell wall biosynthesis